MFKIESYITPILLSYIDKYVKDFKPADAQVSLWGGGVALHNLVVKGDVLQKELNLPFSLVSGRIHELLIQVPWTKIMSEPIVITIDTIECVLNLRHNPVQDDSSPSSNKPHPVEAPPGYMQALIRKIVSNISLRVQHLIVKYVEDDIVLSLNIKELNIDAAGLDWNPCFADIDPVEPYLRRLVNIDDLTLCLDQMESDGKIRFYQEPVLYRCQISLRMLTKLASVTTRRAISLSIQLISSKLAWSLTSEQMTLLLRLIRSKPVENYAKEPPEQMVAPRPDHASNSSLNTIDPERIGSWSEWAWSFIPTWSEREHNLADDILEHSQPKNKPLVHFSAFVNTTTLLFKVSERDGVLTARKKNRAVLELVMNHVAMFGHILTPVTKRLILFVRNIRMESHGKCACGHMDLSAFSGEPTIYLMRTDWENSDETTWEWPKEIFKEDVARKIFVVDSDEDAEVVSESPTLHSEPEGAPNVTETATRSNSFYVEKLKSMLLDKMNPVMFLAFDHQRTPPMMALNPYENMPSDFEKSEWTEVFTLKMQIKPVNLKLSTDFIHRFAVIVQTVNEFLKKYDYEEIPQTLTPNEVDVMMDVLPVRKFQIEFETLNLQIYPCEHCNFERKEAAAYLKVVIPYTDIKISMPMYPLRVCSAALTCPKHYRGPLWNGSHNHIYLTMNSVSVTLVPLKGGAKVPKPILRTDIMLTVHILLHRAIFKGRDYVEFAYLTKIKELNICGSSARIQTACLILKSIIDNQLSEMLNQTTLIEDAATDEASVAVDISLEEITSRCYLTDRVQTFIFILQSARVTIFHKTDTEEKQAWLFSGPDIPSSSPYIRIALQHCSQLTDMSLEYFGLWTEPTVMSVDPLLVRFLAYVPGDREYNESLLEEQTSKASSEFFLNRRFTPSAEQNIRLNRKTSGEMVHSARSRSTESEPGTSDNQKTTEVKKKRWWEAGGLFNLHKRLVRLLINIDISPITLYQSQTTASAVDCETVRDAMEIHAMSMQNVIAYSVRSISLHCSALMKMLWQEVKHDAPTFVSASMEGEDSFPWKLNVSDMSCYTLSARVGTMKGVEKATKSKLRSQLKATYTVTPKIIVDQVTTTVTLTVAQKKVNPEKKDMRRSTERRILTKDEISMRYFTSGTDFKPTSVQDFLRGPAQRRSKISSKSSSKLSSKSGIKVKDKESKKIRRDSSSSDEKEKEKSGIFVGLLVNMLADTPPFHVKIDNEQVPTISDSLHCFSHLLDLLGDEKRFRTKTKEQSDDLKKSSSHDSVLKEQEELTTIYNVTDRDEVIENNPNICWWCQWVLGQASLSIADDYMKLVLNIEDAIASLDIQIPYNQLRVKIASASIKHYESQGFDVWTPSIMRGRVLEVQEALADEPENYFFTFVVTKARISTLPVAWKDELHPKVLQANDSDTMWEIYTTLAPLEILLRPKVMKNILRTAFQFAPRQYCPLSRSSKHKQTKSWELPFCYVVAKGARLLVLSDDLIETMDNVLVLSFDKIEVNPHPENPLYRRPIAALNPEATWLTVAGGMEGRQYELTVTKICLKCTNFNRLVEYEKSRQNVPITGENPASQWAKTTDAPTYTTIIYPMEVNCVYAPALFSSCTMICGPAFELNFSSDLVIELSVEQLDLIKQIYLFIRSIIKNKDRYRFHDDEQHIECVFADLVVKRSSIHSCIHTAMKERETDAAESTKEGSSKINMPEDSGFDTLTSVNNAKVEHSEELSENMEFFLTMGSIDFYFYKNVDDESELDRQRSISKYQSEETSTKASNTLNKQEARSTNIEFQNSSNEAISVRDCRPGTVILLKIYLQQPNIYSWVKKSMYSVQFSLFNIRILLGNKSDADPGSEFFTTARGVPDLLTEIPPAFITVKRVVTFNSNSGAEDGGEIDISVDRPIELKINTRRLMELEAIYKMVKQVFPFYQRSRPDNEEPILYILRKKLVTKAVTVLNAHTDQVCVTFPQGSIGWTNLAFNLTCKLRPDRIECKTLITSFLIAISPSPDEIKMPLVHPVSLGCSVEALWQPWMLLDFPDLSKVPVIRCNMEVDRVTVNLKPVDLELYYDIRDKMLLYFPAQSETHIHIAPEISAPFFDEQHYKDDLRSGAFKLEIGNQMPKAYHVTLHDCAVVWRYPYPRTISKIVAHPLVAQHEDVQCVIEFFNITMTQWEPYLFFKIPTSEQKEYEIVAAISEMVFALLWRCRTCDDCEIRYPVFSFNDKKFLPNDIDPTTGDHDFPISSNYVDASELASVLRIDSYFSARHLSKFVVSCRMTNFNVYFYNRMPNISCQTSALDGYYLSRPLNKDHRVLAFVMNEPAVQMRLNSATDTKIIVSSKISVDIYNCETGIMDEALKPASMECSVYFRKGNYRNAIVRFRTSSVQFSLNITTLRVMQSLFTEWKHNLQQEEEVDNTDWKRKQNFEVAREAEKVLEGRVALWLHNGCEDVLIVGQENTEEMIFLDAGARLAYRWRSVTAPKSIRFCFANPKPNVFWSESVPFLTGSNSVKMYVNKMAKAQSSMHLLTPPTLFVDIQEESARRVMHLSGRLVLGNATMFTLLLKMRAFNKATNEYETFSTGELRPYTVGRSVICSSDKQMVLKIKLANSDAGWSGNVPLKECPNEKMPWLVKVPKEGKVPYITFWCRFVRARNDTKVMATIWPLYIVRSHLSLDADALMTTEPSSDLGNVELEPSLQAIKGQGVSTHLLPPGTTLEKHLIVFQYKGYEYPIRVDPVPLDYSVLEESIFNWSGPVNSIDERINDIREWFRTSGLRESDWPYSIVKSHWYGHWTPAQTQPRSDVLIKYESLTALGGSTIMLTIYPFVILCNATSTCITLRSHDATPLCLLDPGSVLGLPASIMHTSFFISVEKGRETFVSRQLEVHKGETGRYGKPPEGSVALDHPALFAIKCNRQVHLLTLHYEIINDINVLGASCYFVLLNRLDIDIGVSAVAVPAGAEKKLIYGPQAYVTVPPSHYNSIEGTPIDSFTLQGRWHGHNASELIYYIYLNHPATTNDSPLAIRLKDGPLRRPLSLHINDTQTIPVVVTQLYNQGQWLVTVVEDPCPQYVVNNKTTHKLLLGLPAAIIDEPSTSRITVVDEVVNVPWYFHILPGMQSHYSTPAHCNNFKPMNTSEPILILDPFNYLTIAKHNDTIEEEPTWCQPIMVCDGEQLVQLPGDGLTIKINIACHPHSSKLEILDIDPELDLPASDIRKRLNTQCELQGASSSRLIDNPIKESSSHSLPVLDEDPEPEIIESDEKIMEVFDVSSGNKSEEDVKLENKPLVIQSVSFVDAKEASRSSTSKVHFDSSKERMEYEDILPQERLRGVFESIAVLVAASADSEPLVAIFADRLACKIVSDSKIITTVISVAELQVDNPRHHSGHYDFPVVLASTSDLLTPEVWPPSWNMFSDYNNFSLLEDSARALLTLQHEMWTVSGRHYLEWTQVEARVGPIAVYVEDAFMVSLVQLFQSAKPKMKKTLTQDVLSEVNQLQTPIRIKLLYLHPLDISLTLHTATHLYIAIDQSPLLLSSFKLEHAITSIEQLTHALTVHYLSAALLGAGWVVGGLELLGAPGALAYRVTNATGGVRGIVSTTAAALVRSLSSLAGSLARNLDILAGDEEHVQRAAAARRAVPPNLVSGLATGITNFAINILGAVGGIAHHPLLSVAVGETQSSATALRRGVLGALTKPLSATADLVAFAGNGLLQQTGWDVAPKPRDLNTHIDTNFGTWKADCVRWVFLLNELCAIDGYQALLDDKLVLFILTPKYILLANPDTDVIFESIDLKQCSLKPLQGHVVEILVKGSKRKETDNDDLEKRAREVSLARVARFAGSFYNQGYQIHVMKVLPGLGLSFSLYSTLKALIQHNSEAHIRFL